MQNLLRAQDLHAVKVEDPAQNHFFPTREQVITTCVRDFVIVINVNCAKKMHIKSITLMTPVKVPYKNLSPASKFDFRHAHKPIPDHFDLITWVAPTIRTRNGLFLHTTEFDLMLKK
jgi:hypothetical protein